MTDLEQLFRQLVANVAASDPKQLHRPMTVRDVVETFLPYRTNRRALGCDLMGDYELLLLRFFAGDEGLARLESDEIRARFESEAQSPNPDLGLIGEAADARFTLASEPLAYALGPGPDRAYAPPDPDSEPELDAPPETSAPPSVSELLELDPVPAQVDRCNYCGGVLPAGHVVNFCPHCGESQGNLRCPGCRAELELGWHYCVGCGRLVDAS